MSQTTPLTFTNMAELADYLGVTKVSVSLALRNSPAISEKLRERVQSVAREANFVPRGYRRKAKAGAESGEKIAILYNPRRKSDPVAQEIQSCVVRRLTELNLPFELLENTASNLQTRIQDGFTGVIFDFSTRPEVLSLVSHLPCVAVMHEELEGGRWDNYRPHEFVAGKLAADYLLKQGFRRTLIVWERWWTYLPEEHQRLQGFRTQARKENVEVMELGYDHCEPARNLSESLLEILGQSEEPLGVFAFCDQIAYQLCTILDIAGYKRKAGKLEVISCDNTALIRSLSPSLPVVDLHISDIAMRAVDGLAWKLKNPKSLPQDVLLWPELMAPESVR